MLSEARSHTAAALRSDAAVDALLRQAGVLRFRGGEELFDAAEFFERQPLPSGRRIGIVSNSAGVATLAADACATRGLQVSEASEAQNPLLLGISAGPDEYAASIRALLGDAGIDALMVFYVDIHDGDPEAVLDAISAVCEGQPKPVVASVCAPTAGCLRGAVGRAELPVPRVVCRRARARGRTSRMALAAARRAPALSRPRPAGGARGDRFSA